VAATQREVLFEDADHIRVRWRRSEAPPPYTYAITVEFEEEHGVWRTVRLWDNADDVHEHHLHAYTRPEGKQRPVILPFGSVNDAMAAAVAEARKNAAEIVRQWRES
jgi:hypothetical protein